MPQRQRDHLVTESLIPIMHLVTQTEPNSCNASEESSALLGVCESLLLWDVVWKAEHGLSLTRYDFRDAVVDFSPARHSCVSPVWQQTGQEGGGTQRVFKPCAVPWGQGLSPCLLNPLVVSHLWQQTEQQGSDSSCTGCFCFSVILIGSLANELWCFSKLDCRMLCAAPSLWQRDACF